MRSDRTSQVRSIGIGMIVTAVLVMTIGFSRPVPQTNAVADVLEATGELKWYRGNLHTHSHWSDGDDYLEMIALWYRDHDYDFLAFTDHNTLADKERWVEIDKTKGGRTAYDKLKARFPDGWSDERTVDGIQQIRLKRFDEVFDRLN